MLVVVTGSPGSGKRTIGRILANKLGFPCIEINKIAVENSLVDNQGEAVIKDLANLMKRVLGRYKDVVVVGHLSPFVIPKKSPSIIAVLRCSPHILRNRLEKRGYPKNKIVDNLWSEILDTCLQDAIKKFGVENVAEFDSSVKSAESVAEEIISALETKRNRRLGIVRWLKQLERDRELLEYLNEPVPSNLPRRPYGRVP